jgi:hypothetical protein
VVHHTCQRNCWNCTASDSALRNILKQPFTHLSLNMLRSRIPSIHQGQTFTQSFIRGYTTHISNNTEQHFHKKGAEFWKNPTTGCSVWSEQELKGIKKTHREPGSFADTCALITVKSFRLGFDVFRFVYDLLTNRSGYKFGKLSTAKVLKRAVFLETVAGVPGFAAGCLRHLSSLRNMKRDNGCM